MKLTESKPYTSIYVVVLWFQWIYPSSKQFHSLDLPFKLRTKYLTTCGNSFLLFAKDAQNRNCCWGLIFKMRVVGQLSTLVTCTFIPALRTHKGKVWWERALLLQECSLQKPPGWKVWKGSSVPTTFLLSSKDTSHSFSPHHQLLKMASLRKHQGP